ncbi:dTDP-4-dehydrorhamnose reductase [Aeromonas media]|uniref:dTDP-4-dehydrorhamnose reductase n=1 Tax=Aeromonas media TaxID=651 RepID=UPI001CF427D8|nr:dTDP-4-dehydrorhamnose reductase [Aeromonas media]UCP16153.1 dTDP-4-dehydrorhamnose reductase [Aeromonas media]
MQLLLLGGSGELGQVIARTLSFNALGWQVTAPRHADCDFGDHYSLADFIGRAQPSVIINAAAYTQVDQAESESERAYQVNTQAAAVLAEEAKRIGALLVHFSTDYVFDGSGDLPWSEEDKPAPLNVYGLSKWNGEQVIQVSGCRHLVLRTSWLHSPYGHNFVKTMLRLGQQLESLSVVCDQIGAPTSATMLARGTLRAIELALVNPALCGLYHVTAGGEVSWFDYACFIFAKAQKLGFELKVREIKPVPSCVYPAVAKRPLNSRLDTTKFCSSFGFELPHWREGVEETLNQLLKK